MATPGGKSVNRPTNPKQKEEDINRKLQLYGILTAFQNGKGRMIRKMSTRLLNGTLTNQQSPAMNRSMSL
jgi:hypothetical protein